MWRPDRTRKELNGSGALANQGKKLVSSFFILPECAQHGARNSAGMLFLDAAHHHAEMARFANYSDPGGIYQFLNGLGNLLREPFLDLKAACEYINQPWDL